MSPSSNGKTTLRFPAFLRAVDFPKKMGICEMLWAKRLESHGITDVMTGSGLVWKLDLRNGTHRWMVYGLYDPAFLSWAKRFLPPDGVVVDSGANIGQTVMYLGQYVPEGRLLAFEPGGTQADWLERCVEQNRARLRSVKVLRWGLGALRGSLFLKDTWGGERFHGASSEISRESGEPVRIERLDDVLKEQRVERLDLWKLDVEGYELPALEGAGRWLKERKIRALYVELYRQEGDAYRENGRRIRRYLAQCGYQCHIFTPWTRRLVVEKKETDSANGVFLPSR